MEDRQTLTTIDEVIETLRRKIDICQRQLITNGEVELLIKDAHKKVLSILTPDSVPFRVYDRETNTRGQWHRDPEPGWAQKYVSPNAHEQIVKRIDLLERVANEIEPEFLRKVTGDKTQFYFDAGDRYKPKKEVFNLLHKAVNKLVIVDMYLDEQIFDYIESLPPVVEIKLITSKKKPIFQTLFNALRGTRSNLHAKASVGCHDRFIVVDSSEVWQLGASFNGFGKAAFMLNKVTDEKEHERFITDLQNWWTNGEDLET